MTDNPPRANRVYDLTEWPDIHVETLTPERYQRWLKGEDFCDLWIEQKDDPQP